MDTKDAVLEQPPRLDETVPGGRYIRGGRADRMNGIHYGGQIVNAEGEVLDEFEPEEVNDGTPRKKPKGVASADSDDVKKLRDQLDKSDAEKAEAQRVADQLADKLRLSEAANAELQRLRQEDQRMAELAKAEPDAKAKKSDK